VVDADLKGYFDSIPQDKMMEAVAEHIADGPLLEFDPEVSEARSHGERQRMAADGKGDAPRAVISPLLANIYLNPLDHLMARTGREMVRYADDFVILCQSEKESQRGAGTITRMGGRSGADPASDQNADCQCQPDGRL